MFFSLAPNLIFSPLSAKVPSAHMPQVTGNLDLADTKSDLDAGTNWVLGYKSVPNYWGESDSHNGGVDSFQVALFIGHAELFFPSTESEPVVTTERYLLC